MKPQSDMFHSLALQGCDVRIEIPDVDRSKRDSQSIIIVGNCIGKNNRLILWLGQFFFFINHYFI